MVGSRKKLSTGPDERGHFGPFGGRFAPETLMAPLEELARAYDRLSRDRRFRDELDELLRNYVGRPTPLTFADRLSRELGGARIFLKREDLLHTGAHKINNALGQALLARAMKKKRVIAETGAGQHGVATATAAALLGLDCVVYMGEEDMRRQHPNVERMRLLGTEVVPVSSGSKTLKDAINEAMRDWVTNVRTTHYILGSVLGPDPFPRMVRDFHRVIGEEAKRQIRQRTGRKGPDAAIACVGGGSNAIGLFSAFLEDSTVRLIGVEAGGRGTGLGEHAARFARDGGSLGVLHGTRTMVLQDADGQVAATHSVSAGLDYPAVGPGARTAAPARTDRIHHGDRRRGDRRLPPAGRDGGDPAGARKCPRRRRGDPKRAPGLSRRHVLLVNLSGRGDKDLESVIAWDAAHPPHPPHPPVPAAKAPRRRA